MLKVAVDVGRSSVKFAYKDKVRSFSFLVARGKKTDADEALYNKDLEWAWIDGREILFGETARLLGNSIIQHTEGKEYRDDKSWFDCVVEESQLNNSVL